LCVVNIQNSKIFEMDLDSYQDEIGGITKYQLAILGSICTVIFGAAFTNEAALFISAVPKHR